MKKFIIGFICGSLICGGVAYAAYLRISLQDGSGNEVGTTTNPLYFEVVP